MFRQILFLLTFVLVACGAPKPSVAEPRLTPAEQADASVKITATCGDKMFGGSGVLVADRTVMTAAHVVLCPDGMAADVTVEHDGRSVDVMMVTTDATPDLARLMLAEPFSGVKIPQLGPKPAIDDRVCLQPRTGGDTRSCGWVLSLSDRPTGDIRFSAFVWFGNSGSGVFDSRGRLIGIAVMLVRAQNGQIIGGLATSLAGRGWI